jgi:diacylglycerol kinase (ATP)
MREPRFSIMERLQSLRHAARGVALMARTQHNARIHLAAMLLVVALGCWLRISTADWRWLILAIVLVWAAEAMNTALEHLCNVVSPGLNPSVRMAKDIGAGAVLISSAGAAVLGILVFLPYLRG